MKITLRKAEVSDFKSIHTLFTEFAQFENLPQQMVNTVDRMIREQTHFNAFVLETPEKEIIGYAAYFFCYYTWSGKALYMDDLYIRPAYRGKGLGTLLIQEIRNLAKETGCHKMRWQVSEWNESAIRFYTKLGARIDSVERNCDLEL